VQPGATITQQRCRVCAADGIRRVGAVTGRYAGRDFELTRCAGCGFASIADPWTDFAQIYDERYYAGEGADPLVDYEFELSHPDKTVRAYEWRGIASVVEQLIGPLAGVRWLDFGCGNGGLIRHLRAHTGAGAVGVEDGSIATAARAAGIPVLGREQLQEGSFDVVTAIEVLEHVLDPVAELRAIRALLRPGGLLFLTTGNAAPFAERLAEWPYIVPEIHISFFEPRTLELALHESGFRPAPLGACRGFDQILKFKVLKNLRVRRRNRLTDAIPARPLAALADRRVQLREHPIGWAV
jgi:SAM-dependent methyltransferase